jgi:hypothetical protein
VTAGPIAPVIPSASGPGRVADRAIISALGWRGGDRLTLTTGAGVMVARRDPRGMVTVPGPAHIVIPAALQHRCGLRTGDRVLLAALAAEDTLAAYSFAVVDQAIRAYGGSPAAKGGRDHGEHRRGAGHVRAAVVEAALVLLERMGLPRQTCRPSPRHDRNCRPSPSPSRSCRRQ